MLETGEPIAPGGQGAATQTQAVRVLHLPFASLRSRIITVIFAAALATSLAVTWISTQSTEEFLHRKIDQKFPSILRSAAGRLEIWFSQRELDIQTFARSATTIESAERLLATAAGTERGRSDQELRRYLTYVLESFPQYQTLFVLDREGERLVWVGAEFDRFDAFQKRLAAVSETSVSDLARIGGRGVQVASAPVLDPHGLQIASLHALIEIPTLGGVLSDDDLGDSGRIYLVDAQGEPLMAEADGKSDEWRRPSPAEGDTETASREYTNEAGEHVIGSSLRFERFDWTIVVEEPYEDAFAPVVSMIREILAINLGIVSFFSLIAYGIARSIVGPIHALSKGALRIANGETDVVIDAPRSRDEVSILTRAFNMMSDRLRRNQVELQKQRLEIEEANRRLVSQNEELARLSITDDLTKLYNYRFFQDQLPREVKRAKRTKQPFSLILIDIDDFKQLNDRYGHAVGDAVLRRIAVVMRRVVRETDFLARYGGEEFALLVIHSDVEGAAALAEKIRMAVAEEPFPVPGGTKSDGIRVTVSIGVAAFRGDAKKLFSDADRELYQAKEAGKDCVRVAARK